MTFEQVFKAECKGMFVIKDRVCVAVRADFPRAFCFCGRWYVSERDFYKAVNAMCRKV